MASLLNIGSSALFAAQQQLATSGHNIANVGTDGYSRQRVELATRSPQEFGFGYVGSGVDVSTIERQYDQFLVDRFRATTSAESQFSLFNERTATLDNLIGDPDSGLNDAMQRYFNALQDVADDPTSIPAREVLLAEANLLVGRFQSIDAYMTDIRDQANRELDLYVNEVNQLTSSIAEVNKQIRLAGQLDQPPNDLFDQRDHLIDQLSEFVSVTTLNQDDGTVNVFVGTGQPLVIGINANTMSTQVNSPEADDRDLILQVDGGANINITNLVQGGKLQGLIDYKNQVLDPAQNSLGRIAIGLATLMNAEHNTGMDLNGDLGTDLFSVGAPQVLTSNASPDVTATLADAAQLSNADYTLRFDGVNWTITRDDGRAVTDNTGAVITSIAGGTTVVADGVSFDTTVVGAAPVVGDTYIVRPTRSGASAMNLLIADPRAIAAADPVTTSSGIVPLGGGAPLANAGTGVIGGGALTSIDGTGNVKLATPLTLRYTGDVATSTGNVDISGGVTITLNSDDYLNISLDGAPAVEIQVTAGAHANAAAVVAAVQAGIDASSLAGSVTASVDGANQLVFTTAAGISSISVTDGTTQTGGLALLVGVETTAVTASHFDVFNGSPAAGPVIATIAYDPATDSGNALTTTITNLGVFSFTMTGVPATGDEFFLQDNTNGIGDNRNALRLADMQGQQLMLGGTASFTDTYGILLADVGTSARESEVAATVQGRLLDQVTTQKESTSGVNLDEEAADLLRFQQAYQAAAQMISVSGVLFDSLLGAVS